MCIRRNEGSTRLMEISVCAWPSLLSISGEACEWAFSLKNFLSVSKAVSLWHVPEFIRKPESLCLKENKSPCQYSKSKSLDELVGLGPVCSVPVFTTY